MMALPVRLLRLMDKDAAAHGLVRLYIVTHLYPIPVLLDGLDKLLLAAN